MIKMCKFCGGESLQKKPIYHNGLTFITNGHYVLRSCGRLEDAADVTEENRNMAAYMESLFPRPDELAGMCHAPHPVNRSTVTRCEICRGFGITKECPHCEGEGEVEFEKDNYTYTPTCQRCDGEGAVAAHRQEAGAERCSCCQGFGDEVDERYFPQPVCIGKARLSPDEMHILSHLPLIAWAAHGIHGYCVFAGGEGVLLGQRTPPEER